MQIKPPCSDNAQSNRWTQLPPVQDCGHFSVLPPADILKDIQDIIYLVSYRRPTKDGESHRCISQ